jgi:tetratricopeptide (TPR) repeat protein
MKARTQPGRNDPCPCGSGKKYKRCCGLEPATVSPAAIPSPHEIGALVAMIDQGHLSEAEHKVLALLNQDPKSGMLWKILSVALLRQGKDALHALRKAAELLPQDPEAHSNLGAALHERGQWGEALASLRRTLDIWPDDVRALIDAANAMRALGQARESVALYQRALQLNPRAAEAHNNLGNAFLELGQWTDAVGCYRVALEITPDDAVIHSNLGNALRQLGQLQEAMTCTQRAIALEPGLSVAHNNLGLLLQALGQREQAVVSLRLALGLNPSYVEALNNLGCVLLEMGERREAISLYRRAIDLDPQRAESHRNLGSVLFESRQLDEAAASYRRALALEPRHAPTHASLGAALRMQGRSAEAEESCRAALDIDANCVAALSLQGELRADRGRFSEAEEVFQRAIEIDPGFAFAFYSIAANRKMTRDDTAWLKGTEALLATRLPLGHEIILRYALGKYFDDIKQYDEAFGNYRQANELAKRYGVSYDRLGLTQRVDRLIRAFDAGSIHRYQSRGDASERPVFVVGMLRSGTSLTEQILASHSAVFGAGELPFWQTALAAYEAAELKGHDAASLIPGVAREYIDQLAALSGDAARVVDKMPLNFLSLGLICAAFPHARIVHMRRHPIDTCLSIYFQYLSDLHSYAHDLDDLAHYYGEYLRISDHWRTVLPRTALLEIPYEALIEDQEGWSRRMLAFIGLPWDAKCLDFHQTDRAVITLSKWQVRQKIHAASVGRWHNYEKYVAPLRPLLSLVNKPASGASAPAGPDGHASPSGFKP